jgi:hypothetical protein
MIKHTIVKMRIIKLTKLYSFACKGTGTESGSTLEMEYVKYDSDSQRVKGVKCVQGNVLSLGCDGERGSANPAPGEATNIPLQLI